MTSYNPIGLSLSSGFGIRSDPRNPSRQEFHAGLDFRGPAGADIPAAADGAVWFIGSNTQFGNTVIIRHEGESGPYYTLYAHLESISGELELGEPISSGDVVGTLGQTGTAAVGPHLHFEAITDGTPTFTDQGGPIGIEPKQGRSDPSTFDFDTGTGPEGWTTTVNPALLPPPMRLGGPIDLAEIAIEAGWGTTVIYEDGTVGPGLQSGDSVLFADGTRGTVSFSGWSADGSQLYGALDIYDSNDQLVASTRVTPTATVSRTRDPAAAVGDANPWVTTVKLPDGNEIAGGEIGSILGSSIGNAIAGDNVFGQIAASSVLGTLMQNVGQTFGYALDQNVSLEQAAYASFRNFDTNMAQQVHSAGIGALTSFLTAELAESLGIHSTDFGGQLFSYAASTGINTILDYAIGNVAKSLNFTDGLGGALFGNGALNFDPVTGFARFLGGGAARARGLAPCNPDQGPAPGPVLCRTHGGCGTAANDNERWPVYVRVA